MNKEEMKEYQRNYRKNHKDKMKEYDKEYYKKNKEKKKEYYKKYYESHKEGSKKYNESHKEKKKSLINIYQVYRYFNKNYSRYISLENYITIMKMKDYSSKYSIMTRLGRGLIDEDEAVFLSGMSLSNEEKEELKSIFNNLNIKRE